MMMDDLRDDPEEREAFRDGSDQSFILFTANKRTETRLLIVAGCGPWNGSFIVQRLVLFSNSRITNFSQRNRHQSTFPWILRKGRFLKGCIDDTCVMIIEASIGGGCQG
ncbi:hypothetical protein YC2023_039995 [Brassica napus]